MGNGKLFKFIHFCTFIFIGSMSLAASSYAVSNPVVEPASITLVCAQQQQFVLPSLNKDARIEWMVAGVPGGNAQVGKISPAGLYTAPKAVPASAVEITIVDTSAMRTLTVARVTVFEDPAVTEAHAQWLAGVEAAAAEHGCKGQLVQQLSTESVDDAIKLYAQVANDHTCLVLQPISIQPGSQRYSFASGGQIDGVDILYISDVSRQRIWNGIEVDGE